MSGSVPVSQVLMLRIWRDNHQRVCLASVSVQGIYGQSLESIVPLGDAQNVDSDVKPAYVMRVLRDNRIERFCRSSDPAWLQESHWYDGKTTNTL